MNRREKVKEGKGKKRNFELLFVLIFLLHLILLFTLPGLKKVELKEEKVKTIKLGLKNTKELENNLKKKREREENISKLPKEVVLKKDITKIKRESKVERKLDKKIEKKEATDKKLLKVEIDERSKIKEVKRKDQGNLKKIVEKLRTKRNLKKETQEDEEYSLPDGIEEDGELEGMDGIEFGTIVKEDSNDKSKIGKGIKYGAVNGESIVKWDPNNREPKYPEEAQLKGITGNVKAVLEVDKVGNVIKVNIKKSGERVLDKAIEEIAYTWKIKLLNNGNPVYGKVEVEYNFKLEGR